MLPFINHDSKIFVWQTHLKSAEYLVMVCLTHEERNALTNYLLAATSMREARPWLSNLSDTRWAKILNHLASAESDHHEPCWVEPPYLWKPEIFLGTQDTLIEKCGAKAIPVGDSLFNGHPQVGNGLNVHLQLVKRLL